MLFPCLVRPKKSEPVAGPVRQPNKRAAFPGVAGGDRRLTRLVGAVAGKLEVGDERGGGTATRFTTTGNHGRQWLWQNGNDLRVAVFSSAAEGPEEGAWLAAQRPCFARLRA